MNSYKQKRKKSVNEQKHVQRIELGSFIDHLASYPPASEGKLLNKMFNIH